jgi:2-oxoglutarate dehydrogenase E2 component (dihydrolipoamide succinyltransferase)
MAIDIRVPSVGESVNEAVLAQWFKKDGEPVLKDEPVFLIETDKVTLEVVAEADGVLHVKVAEGDTVAIGAVVGSIETAAETEAVVPPAPVKKDLKPAAPAEPAPAAADPTPEIEMVKPADTPASADRIAAEALSPSVRRLIAENHLDADRISGTGPGGRITKGDVILYLERDAAGRPDPGETAAFSGAPAGGDEPIERKPMTPIRRRIASRLLAAKQNTAMLTTFNEIDMSSVQAFRGAYKEAFKKRYGVSLGMMSFFIKATVTALKEFPEANAFIDDPDIIYHHYYHIGVAIGAQRGLVVPVIRHADHLSFANLELSIIDYVKKIQENRLELADLEGGTFTITNGGVFGSLLSTPILNMPQSGILGMHKIEDRPVVIEKEIVIRPMMYVAFSYDHRIIDGREAVSFLKRIKECIESPERMMVEI